MGSGVESIECSQPESDGYLFAVFKLQDGLFMACWKNHNTDPCQMGDLLAQLNVHERELLRYNVKK